MRNLYIGPAGTGKTTLLIEHYIALRQSQPFNTNGFFVVPTKEHAKRIQQLVTQKLNPHFGNTIVTFTELIQQLSGLRPISIMKKQMILRQLLHATPLDYFKEVTDIGLFYQELAEFISDCKDQLLNPEDIPKIFGINQKFNELQIIYQRYNEYLAAKGLVDAEDALAQSLQTKKVDYFFIDGFNDFTPQQEVLIKKLLAEAMSVGACLTYAETSLFSLRQKTRSIFANLKIVPCETNYRTEQVDLLALRQIFNEPKTRAAEPKNITHISADNRLLEIETIAREILKLKHASQIKWSDIAIVFRRIGNYQHLLYSVFREMGIPLIVHEGIYLQNNPLIAWLLSIAQLATQDYPRELLLDILKSAYTPIDASLVHQLEYAALEENVWRDKTAWITIAPEKLRSFLTELFNFSQSLQKAETCADWAQQIELFAEHTGLLATAQKDLRHKDLIDSVRESVRAYYALLDLLNDCAEFDTSYEIIYDLLTQTMVTVKEAPSNQVQVYDVLVSRQKEFKIVFLADCTMGSFPLHMREGLLIKDHEITQAQKHTVPWKKSSDKYLNEHLLVYDVLQRAREKLYLSAATHEVGGTEVMPSYLLKEISDCFTTAIPCIRKKSSELVPGLEPHLTKQDIIQTLLYQLYKNYSPDEIKNLIATRDDLSFLKDILSRRNDPLSLRAFDSAARETLQNIPSFPVRLIETYSRCGFAYFMELLKIRKITEPSLAPIAGKILHTCLEKYYAPQNTLNITAVFEREYPPNLLQKTLFLLHPQQQLLERARLLRILTSFIEADEANLKERQLQVIAAEKAIKIETSHGVITGVIDRISANNTIAIIEDYKTGALPGINLEELEKGILPQVWLYAALLEHSEDRPIVAAEYRQLIDFSCKGLYNAAQVESIAPSKKRSSLSAEFFPKALHDTKQKAIEYLQHIKQGAFYTRHDQCHEHCPYMFVCRMKHHD